MFLTRERTNAALLMACVLAVFLAFLLGEGRCAILKDEPMPDMRAYRAGCLEELP